MGVFSGKRPDRLGWHDGKWKPCAWMPNCVNSTAAVNDAQHHIAPLHFSGDAAGAWKRLTALIAQHERVNLVRQDNAYLYAEFKSRGMGYVDDVEFALDAAAGLIQMRSASRLGVRDFGVNRARLESLRAAFAEA